MLVYQSIKSPEVFIRIRSILRPPCGKKHILIEDCSTNELQIISTIIYYNIHIY